MSGQFWAGCAAGAVLMLTLLFCGGAVVAARLAKPLIDRTFNRG